MRTGSFLNAEFKGHDKPEAAWFSLSSGLPGLSMNAIRAADQIISAPTRGTAEKVLGTPAVLLAKFHGLFPGTTSDVLGIANRALPSGHGSQSRIIKPYVRRSRLLASMTALGRRAAREYLQDCPAGPHRIPQSEVS